MSTTLLHSALARLGAHELGELLGEPTTRLLEILDERTVTPTKMADLVVRQIGPEQLLLGRQHRQRILSTLSRSDAERVARALGVTEVGGGVWAALSSLNFQKGTPRTEALFRVFGHPPPEPDPPPPHLAVEQCLPKYPLFDYQRAALWRLGVYLSSKEAPRVLLHMPTGAGKTRTAMAAICSHLRAEPEPDAVIVWLAHTEELCEQASEEFASAWRALGDREVSVHRHFGPYRCDLSSVRGGILVGGLQLLYKHSLTHQSDFLRVGRRTCLVVIDEAHQAIAPTYRHLLNLLVADRRTPLLGLSATPGRTWLDPDEDLRLAEFFSRQKVSLTVPGYARPTDFLQEQGYLARLQYVSVPYSPAREVRLSAEEALELERGLDLPERVIRTLAQDEKRNALILNALMKELSAPAAKVLVFACSVDHAVLMANLLRAKGYRAESVTASTPSVQRRQLLADFKWDGGLQVVTNFGVLTAGFDAPKTNVAFITRPTRSVVLYSQMVGRAARGPRAGGNAKARIITVVDQLPGFRSIAEGFEHWEDVWAD